MHNAVGFVYCCLEAISSGKINIVKFLIKSGLNIDSEVRILSIERNVPIIEVSKYNNKEEITKYLEKCIKNQKEIFELEKQITESLHIVKKISQNKESLLHDIATQIETNAKTFSNVYGKKFATKIKDQFFRIPNYDDFIEEVEQSKNITIDNIKKITNTIKEKIKSGDTPAYAIQEVLPTLYKIHKKYPRIIRDYELNSFLKLTPFNKRFLTLEKFKGIRKFAAQYFFISSRENPVYSTDSFNLTIDDACIVYLKNNETIDQIVSNKFSNTNWFRTSKVQLMHWLNTGNTQNNNLLKKLAYAKKMKNKKFYQNLLNMVYVKCMLVKDRIPSEITSHIVSFLPQNELKKTGNKIPDLQKIKKIPQIKEKKEQKIKKIPQTKEKKEQKIKKLIETITKYLKRKSQYKPSKDLIPRFRMSNLLPNPYTRTRSIYNFDQAKSFGTMRNSNFDFNY
ncbi:hypothetical protein ACFLYU_05005 [Candidatus Dependentiae bacterium]